MKRVLVLLAVVLVLGSWGLIKKQSNNSNNSKEEVKMETIHKIGRAHV